MLAQSPHPPTTHPRSRCLPQPTACLPCSRCPKEEEKKRKKRNQLLPSFSFIFLKKIKSTLHASHPQEPDNELLVTMLEAADELIDIAEGPKTLPLEEVRGLAPGLCVDGVRLLPPE